MCGIFYICLCDNRVASITDAAPAATAQLGFKPVTGASYSYDANGNITADPYKGITSILYNHFDKPTRINKSNGWYITFTYDGSGGMLTKSIFNNSNVLQEKRDYIGNFEYVGGVLESVMHSEGRYRSATARHEYTMKDHLGNTRLVYSDTNNDGIITVNTEILQETHYYPFGLEFQGHYIQQSGFDYRYKYNDIERLKDLDVGIDMAFYRGLDPTTGRWMQVDPKAEQAGFGMSPYCAMGNNPILYADPNGDLAHILIGAVIGGVGNLIYQGISGNLNSFSDGLVAFGIGAGAGALGAATGGASLAAMGTATSVGSAIGAGAISGAVGGATAGFFQNTGNALYFQNARLGDALYSGLQGALWGGIGGAVIGGVVGGLSYKPSNVGGGVNPAVGPGSGSSDDLFDAALELGNPIAQLPDGQILVQNGPNGSWTKFVAPQQSQNALPRGVIGSWGKVFSYRHGGKMSAIEHIFYRHSYNTGFEGVSKFAQNTSVKMVKSYVDQTLKYGTPIKNGFEFNLGKVIGTGSNGLPATSLRVHIENGWIKTAFPFN